MPSIRESIAAGYAMVRDANLTDLGTTLGCRLENAPSDLRKTLAMATVTPPNILIPRQQTIMHLRNNWQPFAGNWNGRFNRLAEIEKEVIPFFRKNGDAMDALEDDSIGQLSFQHDLLKPINHVPWFLLCLSLFKIWVVPCMSVLLPIVMWILPYFLLRFVYGLPITQEQYTRILQEMMSGNLAIPNLDGAIAAPAPEQPFTLKSVLQYAMFLFTFLQSMIQPIQNAMHLYKTDGVCYKMGKQILEVRKIVQEFRDDIGPFNGIHVKLNFGLEQLPETDVRKAFICVKDYPENLLVTFRDLAHLECMWRIATMPVLNPIIFSRELFQLENCVDISLVGKGHLVPSSVEMDANKQPHAILTGPNGGGKSSFLRSVLQSVLFGHAFGVAPATKAQMPRFMWIASGIQLRDNPGKLSMFETEVKFAADCLNAAKKSGPGLILFDELFHSTNPPDGSRTAIQFLHRLWKHPDLFSVVSTHLFPLVGAAPKNVKAICCTAKEEDNGDITFSYAVEPGICKVSSVHTVWEQFGLAKRRSPRSSEEQQTLPVKEKEKDGN